MIIMLIIALSKKSIDTDESGHGQPFNAFAFEKILDSSTLVIKMKNNSYYMNMLTGISAASSYPAALA